MCSGSELFNYERAETLLKAVHITHDSFWFFSRELMFVYEPAVPHFVEALQFPGHRGQTQYFHFHNDKHNTFTFITMHSILGHLRKEHHSLVDMVWE